MNLFYKYVLSALLVSAILYVSTSHCTRPIKHLVIRLYTIENKGLQAIRFLVLYYYQ